MLESVPGTNKTPEDRAEKNSQSDAERPMQLDDAPCGRQGAAKQEAELGCASSSAGSVTSKQGETGMTVSP